VARTNLFKCKAFGVAKEMGDDNVQSIMLAPVKELPKESPKNSRSKFAMSEKIQLVYCAQQRSFVRAFAGPLNPI